MLPPTAVPYLVDLCEKRRAGDYSQALSPAATRTGGVHESKPDVHSRRQILGHCDCGGMSDRSIADFRSKDGGE